MKRPQPPVGRRLPFYPARRREVRRQAPVLDPVAGVRVGEDRGIRLREQGDRSAADVDRVEFGQAQQVGAQALPYGLRRQRANVDETDVPAERSANLLVLQVGSDPRFPAGRAGSLRWPWPPPGRGAAHPRAGLIVVIISAVGARPDLSKSLLIPSARHSNGVSIPLTDLRRQRLRGWCIATSLVLSSPPARLHGRPRGACLTVRARAEHIVTTPLPLVDSCVTADDHYVYGGRRAAVAAERDPGDRSWERLNRHTARPG